MTGSTWQAFPSVGHLPTGLEAVRAPEVQRPTRLRMPVPSSPAASGGHGRRSWSPASSSTGKDYRLRQTPPRDEAVPVRSRLGTTATHLISTSCLGRPQFRDADWCPGWVGPLEELGGDAEQKVSVTAQAHVVRVDLNDAPTSSAPASASVEAMLRNAPLSCSSGSWGNRSSDDSPAWLDTRSVSPAHTAAGMWVSS